MFMSGCTVMPAPAVSCHLSFEMSKSVACRSSMFMLRGSTAAGPAGGMWCGKTGLLAVGPDKPKCVVGQTYEYSAFVPNGAMGLLTSLQVRVEAEEAAGQVGEGASGPNTDAVRFFMARRETWGSMSCFRNLAYSCVLWDSSREDLSEVQTVKRRWRSSMMHSSCWISR